MNDNILEIIIKAAAGQAIGEIGRTGTELQGLGRKAGEAQTSMQKLVNATSGVTQSSNSARESARAWMTGVEAEKVAFDRLRASFDPIFAAQLRYKTNIQEITLQQKLGTISTEEATQALAANTTAFQRAGGNVEPMAAGLGRVGQAATQVRFQLQNTAYQVGDFAVQVAGGTSATRALSQQLPQLLGGFGLWGAVFGAAAAIVIPLAANLMSAGISADDAKKRLEALKQALAGYIEYATTANASTEELDKRFGRFAEEMRANAEMMARLSLADATDAMKEGSVGISASLDAIVAAQGRAVAAARYWADTQKKVAQGIGSDADIQNALDQYKMAADEVDQLAAGMQLTAAQAFQLRDAMDAFGQAKGPVEMERTSQAVLATLNRMFPVIEQMPAPLREVYKSFDDIHSSAVKGTIAMGYMAPPAEKLKGLIYEARTAMLEMIGAQPGSGFLSSAIARVKELAAEAWNAASAVAAAQQKEISDGAAKGFGGRPEGLSGYTASRQAVVVAQQQIAAKQRADALAQAGSSGGGAGGASIENLDSLTQKAQEAMNAMNMAISAINAKVSLGLLSTSDAEKAVDSARVTAGNAMADLIPRMEAFGTKGTAAADAMKEGSVGISASLDAIVAAQGRAVAAARYWADTQKKVAQGIGSDADIQNALDQYKMAADEVDQLAAGMQLTAAQAFQLRDAMDAFGQAKGPVEMERTSQAVLATLNRMFPVIEQMPAPLREVYKSFDDIHSSAVKGTIAMGYMAPPAEKLKGLIYEARTAMLEMIGAQPGSGFLSSAIARVKELAAEAWNAASAVAAAQQKEISDGAAKGFGGRPEGLSGYTASRQAVVVAQQQIAAKQRADALAQAGSSGGGAGGASIENLDSLTQKAQEAMNAMNMAISAINAKVSLGLLSTSDAEKAVDSARVTAGNAMADLIPRMEAFGTKGTAAAGALRDQIKGLALDVKSVGQELSKSFADGFEKSFESFLAGTKSADQAFSDFGQSVLNTMAKIISQRFTESVITPLIDSLFGAVGLRDGGVVPHARGGVIEAYAKGGLPGISAHANTIVRHPTLFAMGGKTGLMGEAGPEAILPLGGGGVRAVGPDGEQRLALTRGSNGALAVVLPAARPPAAMFIPAPTAGLRQNLPMISGYSGGTGRGGQSAAGNVIVNVMAPEGSTAKETGRRTQGNDTVIDMVIDKVKGAMMSDIVTGGPLAGTMTQTFNIKRNLS